MATRASYQNAFWYDALVAKGYLWVEFFFALSGFILVHVYGDRAAEFWRGTRAYLTFLKMRLARLYPLHLFMLFAILGLMIVLRALAAHDGYVSIYDQPYHPMNTWEGFVASLFLVHAWNILSYLTWNGASWFVSVEFLLCLLFPVYLYFARGGAFSAVSLIIAGVLGLNVLALTSGHGLDLTFHNGIWRGMAGFAIGAGLSMLYREAIARGWGDLPEGLFSLAQLAAILLLLDAIYRTGWAHKPSDIYVALALDFLIITLAFDRGWLARVLSTAPVLKLGEWSYAIYMGQTFFLQLIRYFEQRWYPNWDATFFGMQWSTFIWWAEPLALLAVCVVWGMLLAKLIEIPTNRVLRRYIAKS